MITGDVCTERDKDGNCPIRQALAFCGGYDGHIAPVIKGGGHRPCCDVVMDNTKYYMTRRRLEHARGINHDLKTFDEYVQLCADNFANITARMLSRAIDVIDIQEMQLDINSQICVQCTEIIPDMTIDGLQKNLDAIAKHAKRAKMDLEAQPKLTAPTRPPVPEDPFEMEMAAAQYAFELEQQHALACQWLSKFVLGDIETAQ